jgi:membrane protein
VSWVKARIDWWESSLPGRTLKRFGRRRGNVLAGGVAYYAVFSLFPALAVGFTVFGFIVGGSTELQEDLAEYINRAFGTPIIILPPSTEGIVPMSALTSTASLSITGVIGLLLLLWAGLGWLSAMGAGVQAMFDLVPTANLAKKKAIDLVLLVVLGISVLASVLGGLIVTSASEWTAARLGLGDSKLASWGTTLVTLLLVLLINFGIFLLIFKLQARLGLDFSDLWAAAAFGSVGIVALQYFATFVVTQATRNEFLAAFATIIALLLWMNFAGRVVLLSGAWGAEVARNRGHLREPEPVDVRTDAQRLGDEAHVARGKAAAALAAAESERTPVMDGSLPNFGQRSADRTTLAAGLVLGATVATGLHIGRTLVRAAVPGRNNP